MQRPFRLRAQADFRRVRAGRRPWAQPLLLVYAGPNALDHARVGVSVSRRVGTAVVRNRVRRRVREAVRARWAELAPGRDLLFIAREPSAAADWPALRGAVGELLRRAGALRPAAAR